MKTFTEKEIIEGDLDKQVKKVALRALRKDLL